MVRKLSKESFHYDDRIGGELGVWTGRLMSLETIALGSLETLAQLSLSEQRGVVIGNPSQILWHDRLNMAMTHHQFVCAGMQRIGKSTICPGSESPEKHISTVLSGFLYPIRMFHRTSLVFAGLSGYAVLAYLDQFWPELKPSITCLVGISAIFTTADVTNHDLKIFLRQVLCSIFSTYAS